MANEPRRPLGMDAGRDGVVAVKPRLASDVDDDLLALAGRLGLAIKHAPLH